MHLHEVFALDQECSFEVNLPVVHPHSAMVHIAEQPMPNKQNSNRKRTLEAHWKKLLLCLHLYNCLRPVCEPKERLRTFQVAC